MPRLINLKFVSVFTMLYSALPSGLSAPCIRLAIARTLPVTPERSVDVIVFADDWVSCRAHKVFEGEDAMNAEKERIKAEAIDLLKGSMVAMAGANNADVSFRCSRYSADRPSLPRLPKIPKSYKRLIRLPNKQGAPPIGH